MTKRKMAKAKRVMGLINQYRQLKAENPSAFYSPYPWQERLYRAGANNKQRLLMAANRVGKTYSGCVRGGVSRDGDLSRLVGRCEV